MSTSTLRLHAFTLSFLPQRRTRRFESAVRNMRLRMSPRQMKKVIRSALPQF